MNGSSSVSREVQLKNAQIQELQRRLIEYEREEVEKQSEEYADYEYLKQKVGQLSEENKQLYEKVGALKYDR